MATELIPLMTEDWSVSADLFGGNVLADWASLDEFGSAIDDLGVTTLRYPGGSQTEYYFNIDQPDSPVAVNHVTGEVKNYIPLSDFVSYADENGLSVSIVIPTRTQLSEETDELGHRLPEIDEDSLRTFIRDVASGEYGSATINAFEIGNEYWHSGNMDSVEYGRLASEMSKIIDSELNALGADYPTANEIEIVVQMGHNHGTSVMDVDYGNLSPEDALAAINSDYDLDLDGEALYQQGGVNWTYVNNKVIMKFFDEPEDQEAIDGVIAHVYSMGDEYEWSRSFGLANLEKTWLDEHPELSVHVTEWNQKGVTKSLDRDDDYGLFQAEEMLNMLEEFVRVDVDYAQVWPLIQNTDNALNFGHTYGETNAPGAMFSMLASNLPGKQMLDFDPNSDRGTEAEFDEVNVHGFAGPDELLLYVISDLDEGTAHTDLDLSDLLLGFEVMELTILGVADGAQPGSNDSSAVLETVDVETAFVDGFLDVPLDPGEILQVRVTGIQPTEALRPYVQSDDEPDDDVFIDGPPDDDWFGLPTIPVSEEPLDAPEEEDSLGFDDPGMGLEWLLALVPLLGAMMVLGS